MIETNVTALDYNNRFQTRESAENLKCSNKPWCCRRSHWETRVVGSLCPLAPWKYSKQALNVLAWSTVEAELASGSSLVRVGPPWYTLLQNHIWAMSRYKTQTTERITLWCHYRILLSFLFYISGQKIDTKTSN